MSFKPHKSKKCPVCVGHTPAKIKEVNKALVPTLDRVKETGEIPKAKDNELWKLAEETGISPYSLHFHLKSCLVDREIQDQRFQELKDLTDLLSTAKQEYSVYPTMQNSTAVNQLMTQWRGLAEDIEGQVDPSQTVEFLIEAVLGPMNRDVLASASQELQDLRDSMVQLLPDKQRPYISSQFNSVLRRVSSALRESTDEALKAICGYYQVELEAQKRTRAMDSTNVPEEGPQTKVVVN